MTSVLQITDRTGDSRHEWDPSDPVGTAAAKAAFEAAKAKKHLIYRTNADGSKAEQMKTWDPTAERIICTPQTVGG